jgi:hypothetical protein
MLKNYDDWTLPEPPPKPTLKKRGILHLSPEDMQEEKKSMTEKGIKAEDVKNLPPIEEIHGLNTPLSVSWEPGYPDLPTYGPERGSLSGLVRPIFSIDIQDPREGPSLVRRTVPRPPEGAAHQGWLLRSGDIYATLAS